MVSHLPLFHPVKYRKEKCVGMPISSKHNLDVIYTHTPCFQDLGHMGYVKMELRLGTMYQSLQLRDHMFP